MAEEVKTPQATDEEPAKQEAAVAEVAKGVQDLVDLSKPAEPAAPASDEECAKPAEDEEPDAIAALIKDLTAAGLDPSKLPGLEDRLKALAAPAPAEDEGRSPPLMRSAHLPSPRRTRRPRQWQSLPRTRR